MTGKGTWLLLAGLFLFCGLCAGLTIWHGRQSVLDRPPPRHRVQLQRVVDGDTLIVLLHGQTERVRLLRIDTPERGHPGYADATAHLRDLTAARQLELEFEANAPVRDRYGRLLAYLWADGRNINLEQVRAGYARFWTRYGAGRYAESFRAAQNRRLCPRQSLPEQAREPGGFPRG